MSAPCNCLAVVDAMLAARNTRIHQPLLINSDCSAARTKPMIVTEQVEKGRGKAKACCMLATFCPFCGVKLESAT
jgi:hypothetical protein